MTSNHHGGHPDEMPFPTWSVATQRRVSHARVLWEENAAQDRSEPIDAILQEIAREVGGDSIMATWHEHGETSACMTWHGRRQPQPEIAQEMLEAATRYATAHEGFNWQASRSGPGSIAVMSFPIDGGTVTVTMWFIRAEELNASLARVSAMRRRCFLEPFLCLWVRHFKAASVADGLVGSLDRLGIAAFHFDNRGRLLFGNAAGRALIAANNGLRHAEPSLGGHTLADTIALQSAIDDAIEVAGCAAAIDADSSCVQLTRKSRRPLVAAVSATRTGQNGQGAIAVVVYVIDPDQELFARLKPVCGLYHLSRAETKLACLLADGLSLSEAAGHIGVREQTARSYLKQIFVKTDTIRQGELVGLLLRSSIAATLG